MGNCLGFGSSGVRAGSWAASYQSVSYGGNTPSGSWFSNCQSLGARGCGGLSTITGFLIFIIGAISTTLGVIIGFYPDILGTVNSEDISKFAEDATEINLLPHYRYLISVGVFMSASALLYLCCAGFFSVISLVLMIVYLALTANSLAQINQNKASPNETGWQERFLNSFYLGDNPYPRLKCDIYHVYYSIYD